MLVNIVTFVSIGLTAITSLLISMSGHFVVVLLLAPFGGNHCRHPLSVPVVGTTCRPLASKSKRHPTPSVTR